jgi:hypothetical protein
MARQFGNGILTSPFDDTIFSTLFRQVHLTMKLKKGVACSLLLISFSSEVAGETIWLQPLIFQISGRGLALRDDNGQCSLAVYSARKKKDVMLQLGLTAPCDVMTQGPGFNFEPSTKGDSPTSKTFQIRIVGNLKWVEAVRAECGMEWRDLLVDIEKQELSLVDTGEPPGREYCRRTYHPLKW